MDNDDNCRPSSQLLHLCLGSRLLVCTVDALQTPLPSRSSLSPIPWALKSPLDFLAHRGAIPSSTLLSTSTATSRPSHYGYGCCATYNSPQSPVPYALKALLAIFPLKNWLDASFSPVSPKSVADALKYYPLPIASSSVADRRTTNLFFCSRQTNH